MKEYKKANKNRKPKVGAKTHELRTQQVKKELKSMRIRRRGQL